MNYLFVVLLIPILSLASHKLLDPAESSFPHNYSYLRDSLTGAVKTRFAGVVLPHVLIGNRIYMIIAKLLIWLRLESGLHEKRDCLFFIDNGPKRDINASELARQLSITYGVAMRRWAYAVIKPHPEQRILYFGCARVTIYGAACVFATNFSAATEIASKWYKEFKYTPYASNVSRTD